MPDPSLFRPTAERTARAERRTKGVDPGIRAVIVAVSDIGSPGRWPTARMIAYRLQADPDIVLAHLRELKKQRIMRDTYRQVPTGGRERVWKPWSA